MTPNACVFLLLSEAIFRDGNGGKSKSLIVGVQRPSVVPFGVKGQRLLWGSGDFAP